MHFRRHRQIKALLTFGLLAFIAYRYWKETFGTAFGAERVSYYEFVNSLESDVATEVKIGGAQIKWRDGRTGQWFVTEVPL